MANTYNLKFTDTAGTTQFFQPPFYAAVDQSTYAWLTPGYTAQNDKQYVATAGASLSPSLPSDLSIITITGTYRDLNGNPLQGYVLFNPMVTRLVDAANNTTLLPAEVRADVVNGVLVAYRSINVPFLLPASNDPDVQPVAGFQYMVREFVPGGTQGAYITVPYNAPSLTVDLSTLIAAA